MTDKRVRQIILSVFILLFITSLTQTAYYTNSSAHSLFVFLLGWLGAMIEVMSLVYGLLGIENEINTSMGACITWLANPLMFISLIVLKRNRRLSSTLALISTLLILSFLLFNRVLATEAGHYREIKSYGTGYWLWLMSSLTILVGSYILYRKEITKGNKLE
ncbi:hypothetical protein E9993_01395 [Labilibacter sediminis]|nr:hypothetical protein E9993_01395 [Labilibacter sediminis]